MRLYYETNQKVYALFSNHPVMSSLLAAFNIDSQTLQKVVAFLLANDSEITNSSLPAYYNSSTLLDQIANLYGFVTPPWTQYISTNGTTLVELLNFTLYLYKFGASDNFYETHFMDFIPEHDREQIQSSDKMTLTVQSLGRKLDQIEDLLLKFPDLYSVDNCPESFLDYLGQILGYEREDYTLNNVSFRELLKNIIQIYKIKGTNYSFSFFFKFLGFTVSLSEYYFNRDVSNPEGFTGIDATNVQFFLSKISPVQYSSNSPYIKPAPHLDQTKNLNDWDREMAQLVTAGCSNASLYMRGLASYNDDGKTWYPSPWTYFKTNLMEYDLTPFITKVELTSADNDTIQKYIKFLSPTYLFTWININLQPWVEDMRAQNIISDSDGAEPGSNWREQVVIKLGYPGPTPSPWPQFQPGQMGVPPTSPVIPNSLYQPPYLDYEAVGSYYDSHGNQTIRGGISVFDKGNDKFNVSQTNYMNLPFVNGKPTYDQVGTPLRRDGTQNRKPGDPKYIANTTHKAVKHLAFDSLGSSIEFIDSSGNRSTPFDYSYRSYPAVPIVPEPFENQIVTSSNIVTFSWENIIGATQYETYGKYFFQLSTVLDFSNVLLQSNQVNTNSISSDDFLLGLSEPRLHNNIYYWRVSTSYGILSTGTDKNNNIISSPWTAWSSIWNFTLKTVPYPYDGEVLSTESIFVTPTYNTKGILTKVSLSLMWSSVSNSQSYEVQVSNNDFQTLLVDKTITTNTYQINVIDGTFQWRHRAQDRITGWPDWSTVTPLTFTIDF
jgi:phage tail P2-like protein